MHVYYMTWCLSNIFFSECHHALGMESGLISDAQVSASSEYSDLYAATKEV